MNGTRLAVLLFVAAQVACSKQDPAARDLAASDLAADRARSDSDQTTCVHGAAFVSCPGPAQPKLLCSPQRCKWVSTGNPVADLRSSADTLCNCTGATCPQGNVLQRFIYERGTGPWIRERDLNINVKVDPSVGPGTTEFTCTNCTGSCLPGDTPCNANPAGVAYREAPGTVAIRLGTVGGLYGWHLEIEIDFGYAPPKARACMIPFTDAISCTPGNNLACASAGTLTIDVAGTASTAGVFDVLFPSGLSITGKFPAK